ncbi:cAMP-regulated phosphoprotein 21 isoform X3 [Aethina tumida]|uniref:cAMP-regulated phosphoprotein 21 isoform X3 n=1 Tax=Aethina tumida TaxID=116153 RepID=UPI0021482741|nr:cAMP-regulated phosphoprotein 21 isoform X3 [Aethina tumida]
MQQRGSSNAIMENEDGKQTTTNSSFRGRNSKFLVRSHAMREEQSPPREPSPCGGGHLVQPAIKLTPSPELSPADVSAAAKPLVVLSPSISRGNSPARSSNVCTSPTTTLVPSPTSRCSPHSASSVPHGCGGGGPDNDSTAYSDGEGGCSPKYLNKLNRQNLDKEHKQSSHNNSMNERYLRKIYGGTELIYIAAYNKKKVICDCPTQSCVKCLNQEKNLNNNVTNINNNVISANTLSVARSSSRGKLRQQSSSLGSFEGSLSNSPCLSRDSSSEQYTDTTGVDLEVFIPETLNRNAKDRALMLRIEQELVTLAKDKNQTHYKFPPMSSYQRMLVHRCAAYFGMDHNIESSGKCVVVNKTKATRIPDVPFKEHIKEDIVFAEEPRRSILKRDSNSIEDYGFKSPDRSLSLENRRSKSFEEREEEYEKVRRRIFNREMLDGSDYEWAEMPWSSTESEYSGKFRLQPPDSHRKHIGKLIKVQSEETGETLRPCVAKSYSFGGYGGVSVLSRGDSVMSTHSAGPRLLTKQASSVSWRLSPSSSGYKSQSQMSESVTPSPTSTPHPPGGQDSSSCGDTPENVPDQLVWAVTDIHNVPKGSVIINPQTGKPIKNQDGSIYHYDPDNPPVHVTSNKPPPSPIKYAAKETSTSPKKRSAKVSPVRTKSNVTTTATSPSLPYTSPAGTPQHNKSFQFVQNQETISNMSQHSFMFNGGYSANPENVSVYQAQQPYVVYTAAPYAAMPITTQQYDGRLEGPPIPDMTSPYFVSEGVGPAQSQVAFQQPAAYWNQQPIAYYQNNPQNSSVQRYAMQLPQNQTGYIPQAYPSANYMAQAPQTAGAGDIIPVYSNQVQMVYQTAAPPPPQASQSTGQLVYPNHQQVLYTPGNATATMYPGGMYPGAAAAPMAPNVTAPAYPSTPTPNSCASSASNPTYAMQDVGQQQAYMQVAQGMQAMSITGQGQPGKCAASVAQLERPKCFGKGNKFGGGGGNKGFVMGSSQSSTGTNSPAATVVSGYCPPNAGLFRTPPDTPLHYTAYAPTFPAPQIFRQMSNVRTSTPGTNRSSRSPTPASDYERQRMSLPPNMLHQKMPYILQPAGRGQPTVYRQQLPLNNKHQPISHGSENRSHKGRKSKGNKPSGLPPSGRPA